MSLVGTALVESANRRIYEMSVSCGDDRPEAGRGVGLVLTSHGAYARGPWASVDLTGQTGHATPDQFFKIIAPSGKEYPPPAG